MAPGRKKVERYRLNLDFPMPVKDRLAGMQETTGLSLRLIVQRALTLYSAVIAMEKSGEKLIVRSADGKERELLML